MDFSTVSLLSNVKQCVSTDTVTNFGYLVQVEHYLNALRVEFPQKYPHERQNWQKKESLVRKSQAELQKGFEVVLLKLQQGEKLKSLPSIDVPSLPQVPTVSQRNSIEWVWSGVKVWFSVINFRIWCINYPLFLLIFVLSFYFHLLKQVELTVKHVMPPLAQPQFMPPPPDVMNRPLHPQRLLHFHQQYYPPPHHPQYHQHHRPPPPHLPPDHFPPPPLSQPEYLPQIGLSSRATPPPNLSPSPPVQPPHATAPSVPPPGAASASKILEKLGTRFPECSSAKLISLLQQVKSSRDTLAGMSIDEATEQIRLLLARGEAAPGPISRPLPHNPVQRPLPPMYRPAGGGHTGGGRKFCLICQNLVDRESRYPLSCFHTIHKDCIQTWLQSSKNNSCPFCPA